MKKRTSSARRAKTGLQKLLLWLGLGSLALIALAVAFASGQKQAYVCANSATCIHDLTSSYRPNSVSTFMGQTVSLPTAFAVKRTPTKVLGETTESKHIFVNLTTQHLEAFEGGNKMLEFPVSTGKWNRTPTGDFRIWIKIEFAHMSGGNPADGTYYNLYNVPYTMFFYNDQVPKELGFSLHGAYWHNNFGHPMSHGCVNIRPEDAKKLYDWASPTSNGSQTYATDADPGTLVTIYGQTPEE